MAEYINPYRDDVWPNGEKCFRNDFGLRSLLTKGERAQMDSEARECGEARAQLDAGLETIASTIQSWIDYDKRTRDKEGLETTPDRHIMRVPHWPSHGMLETWVKTINEARNG